MNFIIIALSIIIILLLFIIYRSIMASSPALVTNIYLKSTQPDIALSKLKIKDYGTYNIEFWIFVNSLPSTDQHGAYTGKDCNSIMDGEGKYNETGVIFYGSSFSLNLYTNGTFTFYNGRNFKATPGNGSRNNGDDYQKHPSVITTNFPVQKWSYVIVSVQNNSLVELFINGKLVQSSIYNGPDTLNQIQRPSSTESLIFGKKLDAYITKLRINPVAMNTTTAWNNYLNGNGSVSKMNVNFNLTQDGKVSNIIKLL